MNLKSIASLALSEDSSSPDGAAQSAPDLSPFSITENPDGSSTLAILVTFDPETREEKSKAMPKGMKRDDQADDLSDAEDAAPPPRGIFAVALDEVVASLSPAEDAISSKHGLSPLANCRAKDPMYCPYHGDQAIKSAVTAQLEAAGVNLADYTVDVTPHGKGYLVEVTAPKGAYFDALEGPLQEAFMSGENLKPGIHLSLPDKTKLAVGFGVQSGKTPDGKDLANTIVTADPAADSDVSMLDEWIDDTVTEIANSPTLKKDLDPQDLRDLLEARESLDGLQPPAQKDPANPSPYEIALADARRKYHDLRAQIGYRAFKTKEILDKEAQHVADVQQQFSKEYHKAKEQVDNAKKALFKGGKFPNGFAKSHPWVADYNKASQHVGYFAQKDFDEASAAYSTAESSNLKYVRTALYDLAYAQEKYGDAVEAYTKAVPDFMEAFENWAKNDPSVDLAQFNAAFSDKAK